MKKYIIFAAAAVMALAACSKVVDVNTDIQKEINFVVANYVQTKANSKYDVEIPFGSYAWFMADENSNPAEFMVNETVAFVDDVWKTTEHTFYWPKTGNMVFVSYSPFSGEVDDAESSNPVVTQTEITYSDIEVADVDYLYADKVTVECATGATLDEINDGDPRSQIEDSGYTGVPTLFRHALAKVSFQVKANFLEWGEGDDITTWELTLEDFTVGGFYTKGGLHLTWDDTDGWVPDNENKIWDVDADAEKTEAQNLVDEDIVLTTEYQDLAALTNSFVLPQALDEDAQSVYIKLKIVTHLANGRDIEEYYEKECDLSAISNLEYIKINQNVVYKINVKPTASGGDPYTPEDVIITFDPAVSEWENVESNVTIQL